MKQIPNLFQATKAGKLSAKINPECEWVINEGAKATRMYDGTQAYVHKRKLYKRKVLTGKQKPAKDDIPVTDAVYWTPVTDAPEDEPYRIAWDMIKNAYPLQEGTYQLTGGEIGKDADDYQLIKHGEDFTVNYGGVVPTDYNKLHTWFVDNEPVKGIVWYGSEGKMAQVKRTDMGLEYVGVQTPQPSVTEQEE